MGVSSELSFIVVVGSVRDRAQRVVSGLCRQSIAARIEIILVDMADPGLAPLATFGPAAMQYLHLPPGSGWGVARARGFRAAGSPIVAFLEDHCFPAPKLAEELLRAHEGGHAAVGYTFTNANPDSYISRSSFVVDYGAWAHPSRGGESRFLQNNNIAYKRDALAGLGLELDDLLESDWNVQTALREKGFSLYLSATALAAHHNFTLFSEMLEENFYHCRVIAARRRQREGWGFVRRVAQGIATPAVAPFVRLARLMRGVPPGHRLRADLWKALPLVFAAYPAGAIGESLGYITGAGDAGWRLQNALLDTERLKQN